jgi:hypothetical protein|nr:MAG TPA: Putative Ig domain protein [Caudoviricetes sp.]
MAINWITAQGILLKDYEEAPVNNIFIQVEPTTSIIKKIAGEYPLNMDLVYVEPGKYQLISTTGKLPIVNEETTYYFTLRAENEDEYSDRWFGITILNKQTDWDMPETYFEYSETSYVSLQMKLLNAQGNEEFFKISGEMPPSLLINKSGLIYGIVDEQDKEKTFYFTIGVRRDDNIILTKDFSIKVVKLSSLNEPIWITEAGFLGVLEYDESSNLFVKAYDPNGLPITYTLSTSGNDNLPPGLSLDENTGKITGRLSTRYTDTWNFTINVTNGDYTVSRDFYINTNVISENNKIEWVSESLLGNIAIGNNVYIQLETNSKKTVNYTIVSGNLPAGLSFSSTGSINGVLEYQEIKPYSFIVEASNGSNVIQKEFTINVIKGLGQNALKCFYYINNEYMVEYNEMKNSFDTETAYQPLNSKYDINTKPRLDICTLNCFDKILLKHILNFNSTDSYHWKRTVKQDFNNIYSVYYKELQEVNSDSNTYHINGNKTFIKQSETSPTGWVTEYGNTPIQPNSTLGNDWIDGKKYYINSFNEKIYIEFLNDSMYYEIETLKIVPFGTPIFKEQKTFQNELIEYLYILNNENKIYVTQAADNQLLNIETQTVLSDTKENIEVLQDERTRRWYFIPDSSLNIVPASVTGIRDALNTQIFVEKNNNLNVVYDVATQVIINGIDTSKKFIIKWDNERKTYYTEFNGEEVYLDVYAVLETDPTKTPIQVEGFINGTNYQLVRVWQQFNNTDVDYLNYLVYEKGTNKLEENIIFELDWNKGSEFIIQNGVVHFISYIDTPWMYKPELNESVGYGEEIVLPYILDYDVRDINSKPYIYFFDKENESLIEWKNRYYPTLDLFYSIPNTNVVSLSNLNQQERDGKYWTGKKFVFFEVTFEPIYNKNIDIFSIQFYNHNQEYSPEFQLI